MTYALMKVGDSIKKSLLQQGMVILLIMALMISLSVAGTLYLSNSIAQGAARDVIGKSHQRIVEQVNSTLKTLENTIYAVAYSQPVQNILMDTKREYRLLYYQKVVRTSFNNAFVSNRYITGMSLYDENRTYLISSGQTMLGPDALDERFDRIGGAAYSGGETNHNGNTEQILLVYPVLRNSESDNVLHRKIGYVAFTLDAGFLNELIAQSEYYEDTIIAFEDASSRMLLSNTPLSAGEYEKLIQGASPSASHFITDIPGAGWRLHSIMSPSSISGNLRPIIYSVYVIAILLVVQIIWMVHFFKKQIISPLAVLHDFMAGRPNLHTRLKPKKRPENEMRILMDLMNSMLDTLEKNSEELLNSKTLMLREETARQQMEIIAYRNQINPHFLYNTLDCIRGIAYMHDVSEIVQISEALSQMFRYGVKGGDFASLDKELDYVRNYATIIDYRFSGRITISIDVPDELLACVVIKMLIQPIVENAVLHGLEHVVGEGNVKIVIQQEEEHLIIRVFDTGCGVTSQKLRELNEQIAGMQNPYAGTPSTQMGIGLMNIARRLFLHYGSRAVLTVAQRADRGMVVVIMLPICLSKEDEGCIA